MLQKTYEHIKNNLHLLEVDVVSGQVLNKKASGRNYLAIGLAGKTIHVHQVIAVMLFGEDCVGKHVNHIDGNKKNNSRHNLELVSVKENSRHALQTGLSKPFVKKLTLENVIYIREEYEKGTETQYSLADKFGVTPQAIQKVIYRESWKHV